MRVAVIGCGIFGALAALRLADAGHDVTVFERREAPLLGASMNNQNRLHLGFHYPRDQETARQCARGFRSFLREFEKCVVISSRSSWPIGWDNAYFIASSGSRTSPEEYLRFVDGLDEWSEVIIRPERFRPEVRGVDVGVLTLEVVYDAGELREEVSRRLAASRVVLCLGRDVARIERQGEDFVIDQENFDAVVNCTYADVQRLGAQLGHVPVRRQYEYTVIPIVEWDQPRVGITIMDGPFVSILPHGRVPGRFLVYHVEHSVIDRVVGDVPMWGPMEMLPACARVIKVAQEFVPAFASAKFAGFLSGPRVVLAGVDATDARPSIVGEPEPRYLTVLSGKIDHCVDVAEDVVARLGRYR